MRKLAAAILLTAVLVLPTAAEDSSIVYRAHANDSGKIALTFDDGPHPHYTPEILSILREYGVHATFFVIGENVGYYPDLVGRILADGHELGNHTMHHSRMSRLTPQEMREEIQGTERAIYELTDYCTKLLRPPEGMMDDRVIDAAIELDYRIILWNIDTRDWDHTSPDAIAAHILSHVKSGDIILMHDYIGRDSPTPEALRLVIPALLEAGYHFVGVSELLGSN